MGTMALVIAPVVCASQSISGYNLVIVAVIVAVIIEIPVN